MRVRERDYVGDPMLRYPGLAGVDLGDDGDLEHQIRESGGVS